MDYHAFASLAHVRILLVPVGSIRRTVFDKWAAEIRNFDDLRLGDIPADNRDDRARFMPNPLATGHLHLHFPSHPPSSSHARMALFRPSNFPLGVIGIASCSQTDSLSGILAEFNGMVAGLFPRHAMFPLARNCFVFEDDDGNTNLNLGDSLPGLVVIPSMMGNKKIYIGTLLADLCSQILGEFAVVVSRLESPLGNEYLNASVFPSLPPSNELPETLDSIDDSKRASLNSYNSQPELSATNGTVIAKRPGGLTLKRASTMGPGISTPTTPGFRTASLGVQLPAKKRHSGIGAASSHGRLFKTLGDFFLLAGRIEDASVWYNEAIALFKTSPDPIWYASALEGLVTVTVLEAWSAGHGLHTSFSNGKEPWTDISEKLSQAVNLYSRPSASEIELNAHLVTYLYICSVLRHTNLLFAVWSAKGWGPLAFTTMLQPGSTYYLPPTLSHSDSTSYVNLERLTSITNISRAQIAAVLSQAHGPWLLHLGSRERVAALEVIAGMYACIGYKRREAYILREVLGCLMDLIVCAREEFQESRTSRPSSIGAGLGFTGLNIANSKQPLDQGAVGVRENESKEGNESVLRLVKYVCKVHGVNLEAVKLLDISTDAQGNLRDSIQSSPPQEADAVEVQPETHGWPELQVGIIREALAVAEALPDYPAVAQFALSALRTLHPVLAASEQHHLYTTASQALATAKRRGDVRRIEYWSGQPIVSIELTPLPLARLPLEKPLSILERRLSESVPVLPGHTDPFLYNPRKSLTGKTLFTVARNENLEVVVTIRNPFVFDLELQKIALSTSGVPFQDKEISATIPANSFHPVTLSGKPTEVGTLIIRGCSVQAPGGAPREFILPLSTDEEEEKRLRRRSAIDCEVGRTKYSGLMSLPWEKPTKRASGSASKATAKPPRFLECKIIPDQPLLRIRRISVTHGAVMLYNGETSIIRLTLENVSPISVDFLRLTFEDSTMAPAQQALTEGELSVFDTYETEYDLLHRPVFSWSDYKQIEAIAPGAKAVLTVACFGKVGCSSGAIHVAYANLNKRRDSLDTPARVFYTRQLSYPLLVTVYHMLECHTMDIFPYVGLESTQLSAIHDPGNSNRIQPILNIDDSMDWCLFSVDVRNTYGLPFEVIFDHQQEGAPSESVTSLVPPGSTTRIIIPLKKFSLPVEQTSQPIPTLSDRQFVIDKTRLSNEEQSIQRELFWYREEVLKYIRGRWREAGGTRSGELSLRKQRMTLPMLQAMRTEIARVQLSLMQLGDSVSERDVISRRGKTYLLQASEFLCLRTRVTNLSKSPLSLTLDVDMDPAEHVIYEGILAAIPIGTLEPNESRDVDIAVCFVCGGSFSIVATVRILGASSDDGKVGSGDLVALVQCES